MSKRLLTTYVSGIAMLAAACAATSSWAQVAGGGPVLGPHVPQYVPGTIFDPPSSIPLVGDAGKRAHTNLKIMIPPAGAAPPAPGGASPLTPPSSGYYYETPASLACLYDIVTVTVGCNPNTVTKVSAGGSKAIAIVDAYDDATAAADLATFSTQMGLPAPGTHFQVVYATGVQPPSAYANGWDVEESLDVQYTYGMAPKAMVYLVEAMSNSYTDLFTAVAKASSLVAAKGGGEVTMSWGGGEFSGETSYDSSFTTSTVVYFASAGDGPGTLYPCVSPNIVCAGGTGNSRNPSTGKFEGVVAWTSTGGGISAYEARPAWQNAISNIVGSKRGAPDVGAVADPNTGVWVYDSDSGSGVWYIVGGTSVASPVLAALSNVAGHFYASSLVEHDNIYSTLGVPDAGWNNVTSGWCNYYDGFLAAGEWNMCTGVGSPYSTSYK